MYIHTNGYNTGLRGTRERDDSTWRDHPVGREAASFSFPRFVCDPARLLNEKKNLEIDET